MILNKDMAKAIDLTIDKFKQRSASSPEFAFICHTIDYVILWEHYRLNQKVVNALGELKSYIQRGIGDQLTLSEWLGKRTTEFHYSMGDVRDAARLCWLERLKYFCEEGWHMVDDDGERFDYIPF